MSPSHPRKTGNRFKTVKLPLKATRLPSRFQSLIWELPRQPMLVLLTRRAQVPHVTSNCSRPQSPPQELMANPRGRLVKARRHKRVRVPRHKVLKVPRRKVPRVVRRHQAVQANPLVRLVRANHQTPRVYLLKKLRLNKGSRCSNDGCAH